MKNYLYYFFLMLTIQSLFNQSALATNTYERQLQEFHLDKMDEQGPDIQFIDSSQKIFHLSDYRGKIVFLHLWATWCGPCKHEIPQLESFVKSLKYKDVIFLIVSVDSENKRSELKNFLLDMKISEADYILKKDDQSKKYYSWGIPMTYLIDQKGKIVARASGAKNWDQVSPIHFQNFLDANFLKIKK